MQFFVDIEFSGSHTGAYDKYEYRLDEDFDIEEQEDLLRRERRREDYERAKARRKSTAERIAQMRAEMAGGRRDSDSTIN